MNVQYLEENIIMKVVINVNQDIILNKCLSINKFRRQKFEILIDYVSHYI